MSPPATSPFGRYLRFLSAVLAVGGGLVGLGWLPTAKWGGEGGIQAMLAAVAVSAVASAVGGLPFALGPGKRPPERLVSEAIAGIGLRLLVAAVLGLLAVWSGKFPATPLIVWLAASYFALLCLDTYFALASFRAASETEK